MCSELCFTHTSDTSLVEFFPCTTTSSPTLWTPTGCPIIPFSSDSNCWQHRPHRSRAQSHKTAPTWDVSHKFQVATCTSDRPAVKLGGPLTPSFENVLQWHRIQKGISFTITSIYYKGVKETTQKQSNRRDAQDRYGGQCVGLPRPPGTLPSQLFTVFTNPETPEPYSLWGFMEFHYVGTVD